MADDIKKKIEDLQRRHKVVEQKKASLTGQLQAKKEELAAVVKEIRDAGYDPKNIAQERDRAKAELEAMVDRLDRELTEVEKVLANFQNK